jgi:eukaryotic-like serine/threonine-protein kinase
MPLAAGTRLGPYEILVPIGAGGMGEVYRAIDLNLKRDVALKVLPSALADDPTRMARFQREAELLASLNHSNIAQIYGLEESDGVRAIVMELIEGETLADIIARGPIPVETTIVYARQIASAFEYAHDKPRAVIHRDLKPDNVKVTSDGVVKILDFGLAKALSEEPAPSGSNPASSPTLTIGPSVVGMILGTVAYMSPEQASGKAVGRRSDIWSFGVVLYEMVTGRRLFAGEQSAEILAAIMLQEPDLKEVPAQLRPAIERCLRKDPRKRWYSMEDVRFALDEPPGVLTEELPSRSRSNAALAVVAALFFVIAAVVSFVHFREKPLVAPVQRFMIAPPEGSAVHSFAISPDGRYLVMAAAVSGKRQLWLRALDSLQAQPMAFTEDATYPFWSRDSRSIGFFAQGKLKRIAAGGGPAQSICDAPNGRGGAWGPDDVIVFSPNIAGISIQRVPADGGVPVDVTKTKGTQRFPVFLPDGRHFLYLARGLSPEKNGIYVSSLDGKEDRRILADDSSVLFAAPLGSMKSGHILFVRENTLMAQPFDALSARLAGEVFSVGEGVSLTGNNAYAPATISDSGVLLYFKGGAAGELNQIAWYDRTGKFLGPVVPSGAVFDPAISPDGKSVAFTRNVGAVPNLWLRDLARGTETRLTSDASNITPCWSPMADRIIFASNRSGGAFNLFQRTTSGSGQDEPLLKNSNLKLPTQWSRDGRFIVYWESDPKTKDDLWVLSMGGPENERNPIPFLQTEFNESMGQLSPDGHWMAYASDQSGRREVYVRPFPKAEGQWTISLAGGEQPRWRGDGRELFFEAADGKMMAVAVNASAAPKPVFEAGVPVPLFDAHTAPSANNNAFKYDVTADGKRFLIDTMAGSGAASSPPLTVVVNWNAESKN